MNNKPNIAELYPNYSKLPIKRRKYVDAWIKNNGKQGAAAIEAGYSPKTASAEASRLIKKDVIQKAIAERQNFYLAKLQSGAYDTIQQIHNIAHFNIKDLFDDNGNLKLIQNLDDDVAAAIKSIKVVVPMTGKDQICKIVEIKAESKIDALEMLAKFQKVLTDETQNIGTVVIVGAPQPTIEQKELTEARVE